MGSTLWTPDFHGRFEFSVKLDWDFAREMLQSEVPKGNQQRMNELATEELKRLGVDWSNPYMFTGQSALITQIYLGQNGLGLSTDHGSLSDLEESRRPNSGVINYFSHNVDAPRQAYVLLFCFHKWFDYRDAIRGR